jgi:hypothetical protein
MAANPSEAKPKKVARIHRFAIGVNVIIQILLLLFILAAVNYYGFKHFKRWDLSRDQKYALSDQTRQLLAGLQKPLKIFEVFAPDPNAPGGDVLPDVDALLKEYQYAAHGMVDVEVVNPYRDLSRTKALMAQYKFGNENLVIVDYGGRSKLVNATDMADYDETPEMEGQPATLKDFKGEQAITSAILEVTEPNQSKIYLLGGKGGPDLGSNDLVLLNTYMQRQDLTLEPLELMNVNSIPNDAKVIMIIGAKYDLTDRELTLLRDYWNKQGRLFIALDPSGNTPKIESLLRDAGITPQDDRVLRTMAMGPMTVLVRDVEASFSATSPITNRLSGVETIFPGQTQSLSLAQPPMVHTEPLAIAAEGYWGETKYQDLENTGATYDQKEDVSPPLAIAASSEKGGLSEDPSVNVDTSRMVVTGNGDFIASEALTQAPANVDFTMAGLNWLLNRQELIGIVPKAEQQFSLSLTDEQLGRIELLVMGVMPAAVFMIGMAVWLQRRR